MKRALVLVTFMILYCSSYLQAQEKDTIREREDCIYDFNNIQDDCYCYFDTIYNKCLYPRHYWEMPILSDGRTIYDITSKIVIPDNLLDENSYYIHIEPVTIILVIDLDGTLIACEVDKETKRGITAYERILLRAFRLEKYWIPLNCNGKMFLQSIMYL